MKLLKTILNEVRYINTKYPNVKSESPLSDSETIRVYRGFYNFDDVVTVLTKGLSGKERARRIYSYESGNNPKGLFVSVEIDVVKRGFASSGVIIEFSTKISDLEAPVWVGGRSYFVQGEYTKSFKDMEEREQQRLISRLKSSESPYDYIAKSDRPELAETIFDNSERQALYIGDLDPNMIKYVWYNEVLHTQRRTNGQWVKMTRKDFIKKLNINTKKDNSFLTYLPNSNFDIHKFINKYDDKSLIKILVNGIKYGNLKDWGFFPKQIKQLEDMYKNNEFDQYIK
jgi:hypothetical protein